MGVVFVGASVDPFSFGLVLAGVGVLAVLVNLEVRQLRRLFVAAVVALVVLAGVALAAQTVDPNTVFDPPCEVVWVWGLPWCWWPW